MVDGGRVETKGNQTMSYFDTKETQAKALVGKRIEIPVHYDMWMRGARFGKVVGLAWEHSSGDKVIRALRVKLDHPQARKQLKIWRLDFDHVKLV